MTKMMKYIWIYTLSLMCVFCTVCEGQNKTDLSKDHKIDDWNKLRKIKDYKLPAVHSETESQGVIIQNSFPKGDRYADSNGKIFVVAIFWTRVINETANPLELTINFPVDSMAILPDSYLKLFLLPDTMTLDKVSLYGYGVKTDLKSFLDTGLNKPTMLQRTINPKEECLFYIASVRYWVPNLAPGTRRAGFRQGSGPIRTGLVLKEQDLFYRINIDLDSVVIPCGQLVFKK